MQAPSNGLRGYSDFFASGFRAVTARRAPSSRRNSTDASILTASSSMVSSRSRSSVADITPRRARPTSMLILPTVPKNKRRESGSRRSSFVSFSSRLFDRFSYADENTNMFSSSSRRNSNTNTRSRISRLFTSADDKALPEVWITAGGPLTPSAPNGSAALHLQPIDPFASSPDACSMFIDLSSDTSPAGTPKRESFLSLTNSHSSSARSSAIFGIRRERPTSIHTMPLPSRSRRSSLQYPQFHRSATVPLNAPEKYDFAWIAEELEEPSAVEPIIEEQEWDAPAKIDWHQFHIDILTNDPTQ